ncbi:membrane protein [Tamlana nanhaiensis]|uniref:Membrane protein n=1 Tax=Neotamlana nanhaiensis TaxID=1382798 RepID=A0A0D7W1J1_9FLAO|nr:membrane protein [Tamlana nanhaiensis]
MQNKQQKLKKQESRFLHTDKKIYIIGSLVATLIASTPYLFYLYESVPDQKVWDTFLFTIKSNYYESVFVLAWTLTSKLIPLFLLFIWFFTCRHWWYHVLLVPIAMYIYQIFTTLNEDFSIVDSNQLIYLLPIMAIVIPSIYLIRARIFDQINQATKSLEELEEEFKVRPKSFWGKFKDYF